MVTARNALRYAAQHWPSSSSSYPAPSWSPSPSVHSTPNSSFNHRPLPTTAASLDRSFSPPPKDGATASPLSAFRSPSNPQSSAQAARSPTQSRFDTEQRGDVGLGRIYRAASASQSHTADSSYDPGSYDPASNDRYAMRQRTGSELLTCQLDRAGPSASHCLPFLSSLLGSAQRLLGYGHPTKPPVDQYGSSNYQQPTPISQNTLLHQTSFTSAPHANTHIQQAQQGIFSLAEAESNSSLRSTATKGLIR